MPDAAGLVFGELHLPRPLDVVRVVEWLTHLASDPGSTRLVLETRADRTGVRYLLGASAGAMGRLSRQLTASIPGTVLATGDLPVRRQSMEAVKRLRLRPRDLPLRTDLPDATTRALLSSLAMPLGGDEGLVVQTVFGRSRTPHRIPNQVNEPAPSLWTLLTTGEIPASADTRRRLKQRHGQAGFATVIRLGAASSEP